MAVIFNRKNKLSNTVAANEVAIEPATEVEPDNVLDSRSRWLLRLRRPFRFLIVQLVCVFLADIAIVLCAEWLWAITAPGFSFAKYPSAKNPHVIRGQEFFSEYAHFFDSLALWLIIFAIVGLFLGTVNYQWSRLRGLPMLAFTLIFSVLGPYFLSHYAEKFKFLWMSHRPDAIMKTLVTGPNLDEFDALTGTRLPHYVGIFGCDITHSVDTYLIFITTLLGAGIAYGLCALCSFDSTLRTPSRYIIPLGPRIKKGIKNRSEEQI